MKIVEIRWIESKLKMLENTWLNEKERTKLIEILYLLTHEIYKIYDPDLENK